MGVTKQSSSHATHAMTSRQKYLVRQTFAELEAHSSVAPLVFYRRLFTVDPSLRGLFHSDIEQQGRKLMDALSFIVATLEAPQTQADTLAALGRRHSSYGVRSKDYDSVGAALIWMLEQELGPAFSPDAKVAWETIYEYIATTMKEAATSMQMA
jgi:hemoglobin-like flavoprotein